MNVNGLVKMVKVFLMFIDVYWWFCIIVDILIQQGYNVFIYCYEGRVDVGGIDINVGILVVFSDGNQVMLNCGNDILVVGKVILVVVQFIGELIV